MSWRSRRPGRWRTCYWRSTPRLSTAASARGVPGAEGVGRSGRRTEIATVECDVVLNAITGSLDFGRRSRRSARGELALANKESLIVGGPLVVAAARPGQIIPVDSEHSALAQCLRGGRRDEVSRLILTASGGPFRGRARDTLGDITPEQALTHPTWDMGRSSP